MRTVSVPTPPVSGYGDTPESVRGEGFHPPVQGHAGPRVFSMDVPLHPLVLAEIRKLSTPGGLKWLAAGIERSLFYRDFIIERIRSSELPEELYYLPIIESTYVVTAVSRSGAAGLWQFMTNSISPFDMVVNEWIDERFDFWKSTDGSLRKLAENYRYFGDWALALGAYNCGLGRMSRIIKSTGISDYWELAAGGHLPAETAQYVPKFLAVVYLASAAGRNGIPLRWRSAATWDRVRLDQSVDITILSAAAGVPVDVLKKGNAELRYGITPPESKTYHLKVPSAYAGAVRKTLEEKKLKLLNFYLHRVQSGDTLYELSRHFGVSVSMILQYNPGTRPEALRIGMQLIVPSLKKTEPFIRVIDVEELKSFTGIHTVTAGDTLWNIARRYGTTPEKVAAANDITLERVLRLGMTLNVPEN